jgi:hypothetical protein
MEKLVIAMPIWKRHKLTEYVLDHYKNKIIPKLPFETQIVVSGSEGLITRNLVEDRGFVYSHIPNSPLNVKHNVLGLMAKELNPDYFIHVNSDTVFEPSYFENIITLSKEEGEFSILGCYDLYNLNHKEKKMVYWKGYPKDTNRYREPVGTGRCLSKPVMELCNWEPWETEVSMMKGLDWSSRKKLMKYGARFGSVSMQDLGSIFIEVKTAINIWQWNQLPEGDPIPWPDTINLVHRVGAFDLFDYCFIDGVEGRNKKVMYCSDHKE